LEKQREWEAKSNLDNKKEEWAEEEWSMGKFFIMLLILLALVIGVVASFLLK